MTTTTKRILIAGIGGIGRVLAQRLLVRGTAVHLIARSSEKLASLKTELSSISPISSSLITTSTADVMSDIDMERAAKECLETSNNIPLTGFVYAVGSIPLKPLKSTTSKEFLEAYQLNVIGGAMLLKACLPQLSNGSVAGSAVFFSTVASRVGFPNHCAIASAKGGVEAFVRSAASELAPKVRVNCIAPSLSDTPLASRMLSNDAVKKALGEAHPIPRLGTAADSAAMAEFLLDAPWSSFMTGQVISVDGGRSTLRHKN